LRRLLAAWAAALGCCTVGATEHSTPAQPAASAGSASVLPSNLPLRRDLAVGPEHAGWTPSFALLAFVGAAGAGMFWWKTARARRTFGRARSEPAAVLRLSSQALTPHASVHAVRWNGEEFLVGCTAQAVTLLSRRTAERAAGDQP
jgi:hypothetical protein